MKFQSLDEIRRLFDTEVPADEIRRELRERQAAMHPDQNRGTFRNSLEEAEFHRLAAAIEAIDAGIPESSPALVPISAVKDLVSIVRDSMPSAASLSTHTLEKETEKRVIDFKRSHTVPKVTVASLTGVLTFLWLFPQTIADHPVLGGILNYMSGVPFLVAWGGMLSVTVVTWIMLRRVETRQQAFQTELATEHFQNQALREFLDEFVAQHPDNPTFSKTQFADWLLHRRSYITFTFWFSYRHKRLMDSDLAETVASAVLERAMANGYLVRDDRPSMAGLYRLAPNAAD